MSQWLEQLYESIRSKKLIPDKSSVLVAVSGGLDSMVLLHSLHWLAPKHGWTLTVAHFNHNLRGESSDADAGLVLSCANSLGIPALIGSGNVKELAKTTGVSIEMAARKLRHDFLAKEARQRGIDRIALAHHAGDQVELFFLRFLRGAGSIGLAGMNWIGPSPSDPSVHLIRPLLNHSKADLLRFAEENNIVFSEDATNVCIDMQRNRLRHQLIPLLESYQPALTRTTLRIMETTRADAECITHLAETWLRNEQKGPFSELPVAVQRRCIQLQLCKSGQIPEFELIEHLREHPGNPISTGVGCQISRDTDGTVRRHESPITMFNTEVLELELTTAGNVSFSGLRIAWSMLEKAGAELDRSVNCEYYDADKVGKRVVLRHWRSGDRFHPIGAQSAQKLQDLFTNMKVPREKRHESVVAEAGDGEIFWVEGLRISERFKLDKSTTSRLKWQWCR